MFGESGEEVFRFRCVMLKIDLFFEEDGFDGLFFFVEDDDFFRNADSGGMEMNF